MREQGQGRSGSAPRQLSLDTAGFSVEINPEEKAPADEKISEPFAPDQIDIATKQLTCGVLEGMEQEGDGDSTERSGRGRTLPDALAAADIKRLVRASREGDGDEAERIRRRYLER